MAVLIFKQGNYTETGSLAYAEPIFFTDANTLIISGGVSTYTNTEVSPTIPAGNVGYRVATIDSINTGSFLTTGDVSASNLLLDGNATIRGNITMGGSGLDFGDDDTDNIVFKADISSSIIPDVHNAFNLGAEAKRWHHLYLACGLTLGPGPGGLEVTSSGIDLHSAPFGPEVRGDISASSSTFTHLDVGTYLDVDVAGAITINGESTTAISSSGALSIDSETGINIGNTTDKPINIDASTLDIDASGDITIDTNNAKIAIAAGTTASIDAEEGIHIGLEERVPVRIEGQPITINSSTNVDVDADGGKLTLDGSTGIDIGVEADVPIDVDSSTLDIDASGAITISGSGVFDVNAAGALTLDSDTSISIGTDKDKPIDIDASTFDVDASGALTLDSATSIGIGTNADVPIDIDSSTLDIDASGAITVDSTSTISLDGVGNSNFTTDSGTLVISNTTSGDMTILSAGNMDIDAGGGKISIDGSGGIDIGVETDVAIDVDSSTFDLDASGNITLDSTTGINIGTVNSGVPISIGHTTSETTINDNLTVTGNFTVNGTTTYVSSSNVTIGDRIIELNYLGASGNGGLYVGDADGTSTSGSLLWDSTNDYWIAGAKDLEHKILLSNGDSIISGSGTNNQITTFTGTHGVDSSANLTFDGSILRITGTEEITGNLSGSSSGSFKNINVAESQLIGNDLYVGGTIFHKDDTDTKIVLTDDNINITVGNQDFMDFTQDTVSELTINESSQNLDVRIEGEADNKLFFTDASTSRIGVGTILPTTKLHVAGGPFKVENTGSSPGQETELIQLKYGSSGDAIFITALSPGATSDGIAFKGYNGSSWTEDILTIEDTGNIGINVDTPGEKLTINGNVSGSDSASFKNILVENTITSISGSFGRVIGSIGSTNGVVSGSSQVDYSGLSGINNDIVSASTDSGRVNFTITDGNITADLIGGVISGSSQVTGITNSQLAGSIANDKLVNSGIGIGNAGTIDLGESTTTANILQGSGVVSGSSQISGLGFVTASDATKHPNWISSNLVAGTNVTITSGSNTLRISSSGGGGGGGVGTLQQVTDSGSATDVQVQFENTTDSTSKTTGAVTIGGGLGVNNTINAGGDVIAYASSDERLKDNIKPIEGALDKVSQISGNTFDWNEEKQNIYKGKDYGVIAQEIEKVMPELVDTRDDGYKAVKYEKIVPLLIESIKELKKEINELKSK